jgi:hypothetical protein
MLETQNSFTMNEVAPRWASRFEELPLPAISIKRIAWTIQILFARTCVVGEAHGSDDYLSRCEKCRNHGNEFVTTFITGSLNSLKRNEQLFVLHWNQEHSEITKLQMLKRSAGK